MMVFVLHKFWIITNDPLFRAAFQMPLSRVIGCTAGIITMSAGG
jgi:hypothetical protein